MLKNLANYVEVKTKITTSIPFVMAICYLFYIGQPVKWGLSLIFFVSMMCIDLATTAINNYIDSKDGKQEFPFSRNAGRGIIYALLAIGAALGILLAWLTDVVVLLTGALCVACGVLYTAGPVPLSRQPVGEAISGIFHGFIGPFLVLYINLPPGTYLTLTLEWERISLTLETAPLLSLILLTVTPVCLVANVMLANNICDVERDILCKRFTLPYYLGRKSLWLFAGLYYITYAADILLVVLGVLPPLFLLSLLTALPVQKNIRIFFKRQDKQETFILSIKNFILIMGANILLILAAALWRHMG